ncbi:33182_t:CDS:2 [Gigaspora margarita]|uniref:33182_t:CDS:1 n=1 Tax=Gigaspora margarita TaxID=4874 RepID=A0ABN7V4P3_GIGMA|nr:33182_t:CDS:2 [Gigaspora margarita]
MSIAKLVISFIIKIAISPLSPQNEQIPVYNSSSFNQSTYKYITQANILEENNHLKARSSF